MGERSAMPNDRDTRQGRRIYQFFYVKMDAPQDYELRLHWISPRIMNAVLGGIAVTGGWLLWSFDIPSAPWFGAFFMVAGVLAASSDGRGESGGSTTAQSRKSTASRSPGCDDRSSSSWPTTGPLRSVWV